MLGFPKTLLEKLLILAFNSPLITGSRTQRVNYRDLAAQVH